ncbi:hypothetical protein HYDPIDRAFT_110564 [Hydnomerulius pinastri MD-312]|nr:hypothetical protein HYDPIDRAFT_110564 [Hydnomerulius pinastri MD-312]
MTVLPIHAQPPHTNGANGTDLTASTSSDRILSIQSHVSFGYVGGKAAVFPLQCMGYDVDVVNTVNFSNHSGYGHFGGTKATAEELTRLFDLMDQTRVLNPARLLTGYIPNKEALAAVHALVKKLIHKDRNPDLIYLLDPVLGDSNVLYVAKECIEEYRKMLPLATIITPNWFEVETLTGQKLTDLTSLRNALRILHENYSVPNVVISSIPLSKLSSSLPAYLLPTPPQPSNGSDDEVPSYLLCIASSLNPTSGESGALSTVHARCVPLIPGYFSGVGDLFSALLLGHYNPPPHVASPPPSRPLYSTSINPQKPNQTHATPLAHATSHALALTHSILTLTHLSASTLALPPTDDELDVLDPARKSRRMKGRELRVVQAQDLFRARAGEGVEEIGVWEGFWEE